MLASYCLKMQNYVLCKSMFREPRTILIGSGATMWFLYVNNDINKVQNNHMEHAAMKVKQNTGQKFLRSLFGNLNEVF